MTKPKLRPGPHRPEALGIKHAEVWGVFLGEGCITGHWLDARKEMAHAHVGTDEYAGWICSTVDLLTATGRPNHVLLHEIAHVLRGTTSHDAKWRKIVTDLGAKREADRYVRQRVSKLHACNQNVIA